MIEMQDVRNGRFSWIAKKFFVLWAFCLLVSACAYGQLDQGSITGVVQDSSGAIISGAALTLIDSETGLQLKAAANSSGIYVFSPVKVGHYSIQAKAPGFETVLQENVTVNIQERVNVPFTLTPGAVT